MKQYVTGVMLACALPLLVGCGSGGPETADVTGKVSLAGEPLAGATIIFTPKDGGRPSTAISDDQGVYTLLFKQDEPGAELGEHIVTVTTGGESHDAEGNEIELEEKVPAKYNLDQTYIQEVKAGSNEINLELEAGPIGTAGGEGEEGEEEE